jgi:hypothetical protein
VTGAQDHVKIFETGTGCSSAVRVVRVVRKATFTRLIQVLCIINRVWLASRGVRKKPTSQATASRRAMVKLLHALNGGL